MIENLFIGSAASLPELCEPNPHLTISAFAVALAEELFQYQCRSFYDADCRKPRELAASLRQLAETHGELTIMRPGEESPNVKIMQSSDFLNNEKKPSKMKKETKKEKTNNDI